MRFRVKLVPATVLESEQQLMIIATKLTKKHEILFLFSCDFVGFVAINTPYRKLRFFFD